MKHNDIDKIYHKIHHNSMSWASSSEKSLIELSLELELCSCSLKASSVAYFLIYSEVINDYSKILALI